MAHEVNGTLTVSDDVLADLAGYAAKECYGVVGMSAQAPSRSRRVWRGCCRASACAAA